MHFGLQGKLCQLTCVNYKLKFNKEEPFSLEPEIGICGGFDDGKGTVGNDAGRTGTCYGAEWFYRNVL